mgnify:CR=1 FL=1
MKSVKELFSEQEIVAERARRVYVKISKDKLRDVVKKMVELHDGQVYLSCITGVDWIDRMEVAYNIWVLPESCNYTLKVDLPRDNPEITSISDIIPGALFHECEVYDLLGIVFKGNPILKKPFILPEGMKKEFPLRKDYKI